MPSGSAIASDEFDSGYKECIVGERAKKLRPHDGVKAAFHVILVCSIGLQKFYNQFIARLWDATMQYLHIETCVCPA